MMTLNKAIECVRNRTLGSLSEQELAEVAQTIEAYRSQNPQDSSMSEASVAIQNEIQKRKPEGK